MLNDKNEIIKKQIQINWDYAKQQNDIHCRVYLQVFVVLITVGFGILVAGLTYPLRSISGVTTIVGGILIFTSIYYIYKIRTSTLDLEMYWQRTIYDLEKIKQKLK